MNKEEARNKIAELIADWNKQFPNGVPRTFNEENTKGWIDELFRILGWNIRTDIVKEESAGKRKRVDYSFKTDGTTQFLLEAKKPSENLDDHIFQAVTYGYQKSKKWVVLTNFQEIRIYNAEYWDQPEEVKRLFAPLKMSEFLTRFDDLWVLSKEGFQERLIEQVAKKYGKIKPKDPITKQLANDLSRWRNSLTKNIHEHKRLNELPVEPEKLEEFIDEAVQRLLDRILFIRVVEDKGLEEPVLEQAVKDWKMDKKTPLTEHLKKQFKKMDETYNSGLFREHYSADLHIDNDVLERVINETYKNPSGLAYDFEAIDADILGSVYEQYLSLLLRKTAKRASLKQSEGKRKEQGIYYTPTYIVDYIVKNTLGEILKDKTPEQIAKIKVLDPACGSGSFLIKAFDEIKAAYKQNKQQRLNYSSILTDNIHGVDLDDQAVEIARLNLLLKAAETKHKLPELDRNVKCGNSLIDDPEIAGDKSFKWEEQFPEIVKVGGGFDVVIGNPPYLNVKRGFFKADQAFLEAHYNTAKGQYDLYRLFIERGVSLLKEGGFLGFIIPRRSFTNENEIYLRDFLLKNCNVKFLVDAGEAFEDASVEAGILIIQKGKPSPKNKILRESISLGGAPITAFETVLQSNFLEDENLTFNIRTTLKNERILNKIETGKPRFGEIVKITRGVEAGKKSEFIVDKPNDYPLLFGEDVSRYRIRDNKKWIKFSKDDQTNFKKESLYRQLKKLVIRRVGSELISSIDYKQRVTLNTLYVAEMIKESATPEYLCALLNSKLIRFWFKNKFVLTEKLFPYVRISQLIQIPIKKNIKMDIQNLAEKMLNLNEKFILTHKQSDEKIHLEKEIEMLETKIDEEVYKLYEITAEEKQVIESSLK